MGIVAKLGAHRRVMVDTAPIIYFLEEHSRFGKVANDIFWTLTSEATHHLFSSVIALIEVLTQPIRLGDRQLVDKYRRFFLHSTNFAVYSIDPVIASKAAELRAKHNLKTPATCSLST
jgi:hypothetical protein